MFTSDSKTLSIGSLDTKRDVKSDNKTSKETLTVSSGIIDEKFPRPIPIGYVNSKRFYQTLLAPTTKTQQEEAQRQLYGDFFVIIARKCNDVKESEGRLAKLTPIELSLLTPFKESVKLVDIKELDGLIFSPFPLPQGITKILVAEMGPEGFLLRQAYLTTESPIAAYVESMSLSGANMATLNRILNVTNQTFGYQYFMAGNLQRMGIPNAVRIYTDDRGTVLLDDTLQRQQHTIYSIFNLSKLFEDNKDKSDGEMGELVNKWLMLSSKYKFLTEEPLNMPLEYFSYTLLKANGQINPRFHASLFAHPGLIEYIKELLTDLYLIVGDIHHMISGFFDYNHRRTPKLTRQMLVMESHRVTATVDSAIGNADIPKNYFTIFTQGEFKKLALLYSDTNNRTQGIRDLDLSGYSTAVGNIINWWLTGLGEDNSQMEAIRKSGVFDKVCITGSIIANIIGDAAEVVNQEEQTFDRKVDIYTDTYNSLNIYPKGAGRYNDHYTVDFQRGLLLAGDKSVQAIVVEGADIDILVLTTDTKELEEIARKLYAIRIKKYSRATLEAIKKGDKTTYRINSIYYDDYYNGFRSMEIYMGTIAHIVSHHVPMVRGWYDGKLHLDITAVECLNKRGIYADYHYFAGKKNTPLDIVSKYQLRGFFLSADDDSNLLAFTKNNYKIFNLANQLKNNIIRTRAMMANLDVKTIDQQFKAYDRNMKQYLTHHVGNERGTTDKSHVTVRQRGAADGKTPNVKDSDDSLVKGLPYNDGKVEIRGSQSPVVGLWATNPPVEEIQLPQGVGPLGGLFGQPAPQLPQAVGPLGGLFEPAVAIAPQPVNLLPQQMLVAQPVPQIVALPQLPVNIQPNLFGALFPNNANGIFGEPVPPVAIIPARGLFIQPVPQPNNPPGLFPNIYLFGRPQ